MTPYDGFGAHFEDPATYQELGELAPEPDTDDGSCLHCGEFYCGPDCRPPSTRGEEPDGPQGGEWRIECEMREEREDG